MMNTQWIKKAPYLLILLVIPICACIYSLLNERTQGAVDISTSIDHAIPFLPVFILPYGAWYEYLFFYLIYFCFKDTKVYLKTMGMIVIGECVCFIIFFFFQTTVPRPAVASDHFLNKLILMVYAYDRPYNCFPSIHVLTSLAIMLGSFHIKNKHKAHALCIHLLGTFIILSTLFVKQHAIYDLIASFLLVTLIYGFLFEMTAFRISVKSKPVYLKAADKKVSKKTLRKSL